MDFNFLGSWFWYQPTFDSRQEEHSPGQCLLLRIVTEACDMDGMKVVDLGLGAEGYKDRFGNSTRQTVDVTMTKSWSRHLREIVRYRAASALKRRRRSSRQSAAYCADCGRREKPHLEQKAFRLVSRNS